MKMIQTKQSYEDFCNLIDQTKNEYESKEKTYGWKCNSYQDNLGDTITFIITNRFQTTKIMYILSAKLISTTNIYNTDLEIIKKLKETL
jgi:hypothetical protein